MFKSPRVYEFMFCDVFFGKIVPPERMTYHDFLD